MSDDDLITISDVVNITVYGLLQKAVGIIKESSEIMGVPNYLFDAEDISFSDAFSNMYRNVKNLKKLYRR